LIQNYVHIFFT